MSIVKADTLQDRNGNPLVSVANGVASGSFAPVGMRNRIINGDMRIDQRNAGASVTPSTLFNTYTLDRWNTVYSAASKFSIQRNAGSVTPPVGFTNYLGVTSTSAYSVGSSEQFNIQQVIEGFNIADLGWGTANAKTVTLSFWARSSLTGTFGGVVQNGANTRTYPFTYTISSANTWEFETITIAGDTSGTWTTDNTAGLSLRFNLGAGATLSGTAGAWSGSTFYSATGATSVVGTSGATFYITGVQLEAGTVATPFEHRSFGQELALCQRYFELFGQAGTGRATGATSCDMSFNFSVAKRAAPTIALVNTATNQITESTVSVRAATSISVVFAGSSNGILISLVVAGGGMTSPNMVLAFPDNLPNGFLSASAEL
jgi:hypothetical protein